VRKARSAAISIAGSCEPQSSRAECMASAGLRERAQEIERLKTEF
jgi:hypothetical protein